MKSKQSVVTLAPSKVNLYLDIVGVDERQYHYLNTIMHAIDLQDTVRLERVSAPQISIHLEKSWGHIPADDSNIAYRSAAAFFRKIGKKEQGLMIHLDKNTPDRAGLGGGSSDAAAVLVGLNALYQAGLSTEELCAIGVEIGADVPFCLLGGCALAQGIGEVLTPLPALEKGYFVIVKPKVGVSTPKAFALYDALGSPKPLPPTESMIEGIRQNELTVVGANMHNVFEQALTDLPTPAIKEALLSFGAFGACLSGSGSAVVGLFRERKRAKACKEALAYQHESVYLARPVSHGAKVIEVN